MKQLDENPTTIRKEVLALGKLNKEDIQLIRLCKSPENKLGFGYQLAFVKTRNYFPKQNTFDIDPAILDFVCYQLNCQHELIEKYKHRRSVIQEHQNKIKRHLSLQEYDDVAKESLTTYILEKAKQTDQVSLLVPKAQCFLKERNILQPALSKLRRLVGKCRKSAWEHIENSLEKQLKSEIKEKLQALLKIDGARSTLWQLKQPPGIPSLNNINTLIKKLKIIEDIKVLHLDLSWINANYKLLLARRAHYFSVTRLNHLLAGKRYASLVCLCRQIYEDTVDYIIEMLIKLFDKSEKAAKNQIDIATRQKHAQIKKSLEHFKVIGELILDDEVTDNDLRQKIYNIVPRKQLADQILKTQSWLSSKYNHVFHLLEDRYSYFRKFFPSFIEHIDLINDGTMNSKPLLDAINILREMNKNQDSKCPKNVPTSFIPPRYQKHVINSDGEVNRNAWEISLLKAVRDEVKEGNLSANNSKFFCQFDKLFMPETRWKQEKSNFFKKAGLPVEEGKIQKHLTDRLHKAIDEFIQYEDNNPYAKIENDKWVLSVDDAYHLSEADDKALAQLKEFLKRNMREIKLPDLLVEVDNDLHITNYFMTYEQRRVRDKDAIVNIIATWMAWGCGIGLTIMPNLVQGVSYDKLKAISDFGLSNDDLVRYTLADVVNAISELDITGNWGIGLSSSSDSIRMEYHSKVLNRGYSTCFGDYAIEFYTYVADTYAPFFSKPIECTNRDAGHVLDGILYNETGLPLLDHYVDTHGYTEINFTGFTMFGKQLNPRIKNVKAQNLYNIDPNYNFGSLAPLLKGKKHQIDMDCIVEQYDRMGKFYASMEMGYSMASNSMRRLVSFGEKNRFYKANRDFGRIIKTENILKYMVNPKLREQRRRGLLKTEQLHQLSRDVAFGKHGKITGRELDQLKNSCNCLTLIDACIVYWQAKEMMRVCEEYGAVSQGINLHLLKHVSPIEWSNLILYGEYFIRKSLIQ